MTTIIAARLQLQDQAEEVIQQLILAGFTREKITSFYVNPPGQHAAYPIGGDRYESPTLSHDKKDAPMESTTEALIGVDPANKKTDDSNNSNRVHERQYRNAGMLVAVELSDASAQDQTVNLLKRLGGSEIEKAQGKIVNSAWVDFEPLSEPCYL